MTLVVIWPNKPDKPTALHVAADSLLSDSYGNRWPYAPKIFRVYPTHAYLAYCGTSAMALSVIMQGAEVLANTDILGDDGSAKNPTVDAKSSALRNHLNDSVGSFPAPWGSNATLLYCGFDHRKREFRIFRLSMSRKGVTRAEEALGQGRVFCFGSGAARANSLLKPGMSTPNILGVLKSVINDNSAQDVGGVQQMVTIKRSGSHAVGFNWRINGKNESTLFGLPLRFHGRMDKVHFLDEQFRPARYLHDARIRRVR